MTSFFLRALGKAAVLLASLTIGAQPAHASYHGDDPPWPPPESHPWAPIEGYYSYFDGVSCSDAADPIGLIMFGENISQDNVREMVSFHTGWGGSSGGQGQYVRRYNPYVLGGFDCDEMQAANETEGDYRDHVRWSRFARAKTSAYVAGKDISPTFTTVIAGTPHREVQRDCGHVTVDYVAPRDYIQWQMSSWHPAEADWLGNNAPMPQCDPLTSTPGDGTVYYIYTWPV